jgi:hypothetical protein
MSVYALAGRNIELPVGLKKGVKNPDFIIDGLSADVKTRSQTDIGAQFTGSKSQASKVLAEQLCYDIGSFIRDRMAEGIKQADVLFVDLSERSLSFMAMWDEKKRMKGQVPEPKNGRIIFYCYPRAFGEKKVETFQATFMDLEPLFWDFIKNNKDKIVVRRHRKQL